MVTCCVPGCTHRTGKRNNPTGLTFHLIPKSPSLRTAWLKAIGRPDWKPGPVTHLCSAHFKEEDFIRTLASGIVKLREDVIPSVFNAPTTRLKRKKKQTAKGDSVSLNAEGPGKLEVTVDLPPNSPLCLKGPEKKNVSGDLRKVTPAENKENKPQASPSVSPNQDAEKKYFRTDISDFEEIVNTIHFVDKTMLIKTFFEDTGKIIITAPRQFGKSVNMDMLKRFIEINVDVSGKPALDLISLKNFKLFKENNLKIYQDQKFFKQHFGQYPVIFIDFKPFNDCTFNEVLLTFKEILYNTFLLHRYLLKNSELWEGGILSKDTFLKYCHTEYFKELTKLEVETGFKFLSQVLYEHFNKKVFVLIDEYDTPINKMFYKNCNVEMEGIEYIYSVVSNLLKCNYVDRALINVNSINGILPGFINNLKLRAFLEDHAYIGYYGLTLYEVGGLLKKNEFKMNDKLREIVSWYGGYQLKFKNFDLFNTWSIVNYLQEKKIGNYWVDAGYIPNLENICRLYEIRVLLGDLLEGKCITIRVVKPFEVRHIDLLRKFIHTPDDIKDMNVNLFFQLLYEFGYLISINSNYSRNTLSLKIPNFELSETFKKYYFPLEYYIEKFNITQDLIRAFHKSLETLTVKADQKTFFKFSETVNKLYSVCTSTIIKDFEVHALFYALVKQKYSNTRCHIHFGERKRYDIVFVKRADKLAIIVDLKYLKTSLNALLQIFDHDYYKFLDYVLVGDKVHDRIHMGLNIDEKSNVSISYLINTDLTENANHVPEKL